MDSGLGFNIRLTVVFRVLASGLRFRVIGLGFRVEPEIV